MKILIYSPPFAGHLNVLTKMMQEHQEHDYAVVITGWKNLQIDGVTNLGKSTLRETDPALWTFPRVCELIDDALKLAQDYKPDLIVYDFFSLEGYFVGKMLGIPYWCSIPAMVGPNKNTPYLKEKLAHPRNKEALDKLCDTGLIEMQDIEMISDGVHIPGQVNLIWSYPELTPINFKEGRKPGKYCFVGNYNHLVRKEKDSLYFSLGTVVMNNLWHQQGETQIAVRDFVTEIAQGLRDERVIFVTQGKKVLDTYPPTWCIEDKVHQIDALARSKAFITHGGSNSFHEAVLQKVPMVVIPFFGDQILTGQRVAELGIGINLGTDTLIDTKKSKSFLNKELALLTVEAVREVIANHAYQTRLDHLTLTSDDLGTIIHRHFK